jgi:hypothetical protein
MSGPTIPAGSDGGSHSNASCELGPSVREPKSTPRPSANETSHGHTGLPSATRPIAFI